MLEPNRRPFLSRSPRVAPLSFLAVLAAALCPAPVHANAGTLIPDAAAVKVLHVWPDGRTLLIRGPTEELALIDSHGNDLPAFRRTVGVTARMVSVASDGSVFLVGRFPVAGSPKDLVKLHPDGSLDPHFRPVRTVALTGGAIDTLVADDAGGCFFGGGIAGVIADCSTSETIQLTKIHTLAHADRFGRVRSVFTQDQPGIGDQWLLVRDGADLIVVGSFGLFRVAPDGAVQPFLRSGQIEFLRDGGRIAVRGATYDPRFGLAVSGYGRAPGLATGDGFVAVFNLDGTPRAGFRQHVRLGGAAGQGLRSLAWDHAGRLLVGGMTMADVLDLHTDSEGRLNDVRYISQGPPPIPPLTTNVLEGFPRDMWTVRRLLPDGHIDPEWTKALWFNRPAIQFSVLPNSDVIVGGTFDRGIGIDLPGTARLSGAPLPWRAPQQSVRGRVEAGGPPLILGLVLEADRATEVLIRAIGPSLQQFDVPDPAKGLRLTVYRRDERVVSASLGTQFKPVQWTTQRVGAFRVDPNGAEPHLLLQLSPGIYTVHAEPLLPDAGGTALIEVYFP